MMHTENNIVFSNNMEEELGQAIATCLPDCVFVLTDTHTAELCWPVIQGYGCLKTAQLITLLPGDDHKDLASLSQVWQALQDGGATRHSLLINLGGGMITDLGAFAAATFKRGIAFINMPTTLLAMVDASVGGKTGINFGGLKNEIGAFRNANAVIINTMFLNTLSHDNILSGYAEMLKHGLISTEEHWAQLLHFDLDTPDLQQLQSMVEQSVNVKRHIVTEDPLEHGIRKMLNVGHTMGHAFESFALRRTPVLHGYAVAWGMVAELYLSCRHCNFPTDKMRQTVNFIRQHYGSLSVTCDDYPELLALMKHDKKNTGTTINFSLLADIGVFRINQTATQEEIFEALDFFSYL